MCALIDKQRNAQKAFSTSRAKSDVSDIQIGLLNAHQFELSALTRVSQQFRTRIKAITGLCIFPFG